jgi:hypothetical protein
MASLNGTWTYESFRPNSGTPSLVPWARRSKLSVTTDAKGKVAGKLTIPLPPGAPVPELVMAISGSITPAVAPQIPEGIELTGTVGESVNNVRGYFIGGGPNPLVVGTVTAVKKDPAGLPDGTNGPFVLFPGAEPLL